MKETTAKFSLAALITIIAFMVTGAVVSSIQRSTQPKEVVEERVQPVAPPTSAWTDKTYWTGKAQDWTPFYSLVCIHGIPHLTHKNSPTVIPIDRQYAFQTRAYRECHRIEEEKSRKYSTND